MFDSFVGGFPLKISGTIKGAIYIYLLCNSVFAILVSMNSPSTSTKMLPLRKLGFLFMNTFKTHVSRISLQQGNIDSIRNIS